MSLSLLPRPNVARSPSLLSVFLSSLLVGSCTGTFDASLDEPEGGPLAEAPSGADAGAESGASPPQDHNLPPGCTSACAGCAVVCEEPLGCAQGGVCRGACTEVEADAEHCLPTRGEDGCGGAADDVKVEEISVYQSVKVVVMKEGLSVPSVLRTADVISGREALFRVSVGVAPGFAGRELSARLTIHDGSRTTRFHSKKAILKASEDLDPATTFQIPVPAALINSQTSYAVELVSCASRQTESAEPGSGFPASGLEPLRAMDTGGLRIKVIPLVSNGRSPDTSGPAIESYRQLLLAMLPVSSVEITIGAPMNARFPIDWPATLDQLRHVRATEAPDVDVFYYGLVRPEDTLTAFCGNACTTGIGYVARAHAASLHVAMGVGFGDRLSAEVMAHELGHTMGRNHAPCARGAIEGVDAAYPYASGAIGNLGYDPRLKAFLHGDRNTDIMGYCNNQWISDYTYKAMADRLSSINAVRASYAAEERIAPWRVMLVDASGPRWGAPITQPSAPEGDELVAQVLDPQGWLVQEVKVYRTLISDGGGALYMVPEPQPGWHAVQVPGVAPLRY